MSTELIPYSDMERMATAIAKSNLFGMKTADQALALMVIAQAEGRHPGSVASEYHIIQGKPSLKADAMLARFHQAGGKVQWTEYTDKRVAAIFSHPNGGSVEIDWSFERAKSANLTGKDTWKQYPRQMLRARVISEGVRTVYPGVSVGMYTPEEVQDFTPSEPLRSEPINVTPREGEIVDRNTGEVTHVKPTTEAPRSNGGNGHATEKQVKLIRVKLNQAGISAEDACEQFGVQSLTELPFEKVNDALAWIQKHAA